MTPLEQLQPNAALRGILPDCAVTVAKVKWLGSEALELTYKDPLGKVADVILYRDDEPRLELVEAGLRIPKPSLPPGGLASASPQAGMPPEVESIVPEIVDYEPGREIALSGRSLDAEPLVVQVGQSETEPISAGPEGLTFRLPADVPAGVHPVRVMLGPKDGTRVDSNSLPLVVKASILGEPQVIDRPRGTASTRIALVTISPNVQVGQTVELLLNSLPKASRQATAYRLRAGASDKARSIVEVPIPKIEKGKYLMRIRVDGATSSLSLAADGTYEGPRWEVK